MGGRARSKPVEADVTTDPGTHWAGLRIATKKEKTMVARSSIQLRNAAVALMATALLAACATTGGGAPVSPAEPEKLVGDARVAFDHFLRDPDQTWVHD